MILNSLDLSIEGMELLKIETPNLCIISVYKPPPTSFYWPPNIGIDNKPTVVIGDFNSHSTKWGYIKNDDNGDKVENWAAKNDLSLLHKAKDITSFSSARWKRGYNPNLVFVSSRHTQTFEK